MFEIKKSAHRLGRVLGCHVLKRGITIELKIYGVTGTVPFKAGASHFSGNTSCMVVESQGFCMVIDAGTGILGFQQELKRKHPDFPAGINQRIPIVLSHLHLDHIIGLGAFAPVWHPDSQLDIYAVPYNGRPLKDLLFEVFKPPYWPVVMNESTVTFNALSRGGITDIGPFRVNTFSAPHPDNASNFHISDGRKSLVYLLDAEVRSLDAPAYQKLSEICARADVVIFDAAFAPKDYENRRGWGHSTYEDGIKLAEDSGCKRIVFTHFSPEYGYNDLFAWQQDVKTRFPDGDKYIFAKEGMELSL